MRSPGSCAGGLTQPLHQCTLCNSAVHPREWPESGSGCGGGGWAAVVGGGECRRRRTQAVTHMRTVQSLRSARRMSLPLEAPESPPTMMLSPCLPLTSTSSAARAAMAASDSVARRREASSVADLEAAVAAPCPASRRARRRARALSEKRNFRRGVSLARASSNVP